MLPPHGRVQATGVLQMPPLITCGAVQVLQAGGLFAPFAQTAHEMTSGCQAPQLLSEFDSVMTKFPKVSLFAQARTL